MKQMTDKEEPPQNTKEPETPTTEVPEEGVPEGMRVVEMDVIHAQIAQIGKTDPKLAELVRKEIAVKIASMILP